MASADAPQAIHSMTREGAAAGDKKMIPVLIVPAAGDGGPAPAAFAAMLVIKTAGAGDGDEKEEAAKKMSEWMVEMRGWLMVLATLAASVTYASGLSPPGDVWQSSGDGHVAGSPVLHDVYYKRFQTFFYFNSTAFVTSLVIIVLLMSESFSYSEAKIRALEIAVVLDLISLMGAFVAGAAREVKHSIYLIIITVAVFLYVVWSAWFIPKLCFHALRLAPPLERAAEKGWIPVPAKVLKRIESSRRRGEHGVCGCCGGGGAGVGQGSPATGPAAA